MVRLGPLSSDQITSIGVDNLDCAVRANADLVAATSLVTILIRGEETTLAVAFPDDRATNAAGHEVTALDVSKEHVVVVPHVLDVGLALDCGIVGLASHDDVWDTEGISKNLRGDVASALGGVQEAIQIGLHELRALDAVEERKAQNQRVGGLTKARESLKSSVDVMGNVNGVQVGLCVSHGAVSGREGRGIKDGVSGLNLVVEHHLVHAELGGDHLGIEEILHLLANLVVHALLVAVLNRGVAVPLKALLGLVVGAGGVAELALSFQKLALGDTELGITTNLARAGVDGKQGLSNVVLLLVNRFHEKRADVLTRD